jgi:putative addiction module component (TIGR02574 family)
MSTQIPIPPPGFDGLSVEEQIAYVEELLDYVKAHPGYVKIPEWHMEILLERMNRYRAAGFEGKTWEELEKELT